MKTIEEKIKNLESRLETFELTALKQMREDLRDIKDSLEQEKPSYPVGYDPEGEWTVFFTDEKGWYHSRIYNSKYIYSVQGLLFTTKEQAQQKADGLNALKELVFAIHDEQLNEIKGDVHYELFIDIEGNVATEVYDSGSFSQPRKMWLNRDPLSGFIDKLGEEKIKLALKWGL